MSNYRIEGLTYYYPKEEKPTLQNINLEINSGEFIYVVGESGSGKSTLLKVLAGLIPGYYGGRIGGKIYFDGKKIDDNDGSALIGKVGYMFQDPEQQILMNTVEQELVFGMENLGFSLEEMNIGINKIGKFLSLTNMLKRNVLYLSGGEKQKLVLGSVLAMNPKVLILDEPISQLDPYFAKELLTKIKKLNSEMGVTIILVEQRGEGYLHLADKVVTINEGKIESIITKEELSRLILKRNQEEKFDLRDILKNKKEMECGFGSHLPILEVEDLSFNYTKSEYGFRNISFKLFEGEITVVVGENGAGKTTLIKSIMGMVKPKEGKIVLKGNIVNDWDIVKRSSIIGYLPQNPNDYLFNDTVLEEIEFSSELRGVKDKEYIESILLTLKIDELKYKYPRDLSGGEKQRVALGSILASRPELLILDEPTRGIDKENKLSLVRIIRQLATEGRAILLITHDIELAMELGNKFLVINKGRLIETLEKEGI